MNLKKFLENLISTANVANPSNLVGTKTPEGGHKGPARLPFSKPKSTTKLKKPAEVNDNADMIMNIDVQRRPTFFKVQPSEWVDSDIKEEKPKKKFKRKNK